MTRYAALLRAVNVGGTGKLPMSELKAMGEAAGFAEVRTYIASGNLLFSTELTPAAAMRKLEKQLLEYAGKPVAVMLRSDDELAQVLRDNPYPDMPGNRVVAIFLDAPPPTDTLHHVSHQKDERIALGKREIYVHYGDGMADSRLVIPAAKAGTARNMNTVAKLAELTGKP